MTLHWWMHWFWITALATLSASALTSAYATPIDIPRSYSPTIAPDDKILYSAERSRIPERTAKALYFDKAEPQTTLLLPRPTVTATSATRRPIVVHAVGEVSVIEENVDSVKMIEENKTQIKSNSSISGVKDSKEGVNSSKTEAIEAIDMVRIGERQHNLKEVIVLSEPFNKTVNTTEMRFVNDSQLDTLVSPNKTVPQQLQVTEEDSREIATEKPLSLETTLLSSQQSKPSSSMREPTILLKDPATEPTLQAGAIAGMALGAVAMATLVAATSFVLYRRRYLNKPQTLNDKCSNPDSGAYIDDSTIRENSEEMYSLDNDSFLNSLEAMTIQNYWTDNVKHTKL